MDEYERQRIKNIVKDLLEERRKRLPKEIDNHAKKIAALVYKSLEPYNDLLDKIEHKLGRKEMKKTLISGLGSTILHRSDNMDDAMRIAEEIKKMLIRMDNELTKR